MTWVLGIAAKSLHRFERQHMRSRPKMTVFGGWVVWRRGLVGIGEGGGRMESLDTEVVHRISP
jgi:hypothetical protein